MTLRHRGWRKPMIAILAAMLLLLPLCVPIFGHSLLAQVGLASSRRAELAAARVGPRLAEEVRRVDAEPGSAVFIRIHKREHELELWLRDTARRWRLFKTYEICTWSGDLGPKQKQGDGQSPEGVYRVGPAQMNPLSSYHLAFNLGYPNAYDRALGRTRDYLMVHGSCVSIGCYAMGDAAIEEIYTLMSQAFAAGQDQVSVFAWPFRFAPAWQDQWPADAPWLAFWQELSAIDADFARRGEVPAVRVNRGHYQVVTESGR